MQNSISPSLFGLALSGGTFKGAAHVGVLEALQNVGLRPNRIAGTSAGSIVATLYAHGYTTQELRNMTEKLPLFKLVDYGFPVISSVLGTLRKNIPFPKLNSSSLYVPNGIIRGHKLRRFIAEQIQGQTVELPLYVVATDLTSGNPVVFEKTPLSCIQAQNVTHSTDIASEVVGSCALPGLFSPVPHETYVLVDGAFRHYVPVDVLRAAGCQKIIAVNLYKLTSNYRPGGLVEVLSRAFDILLRESIDDEIVGDDLYVVEPDFTSFKVVGYKDRKQCIQLGYSEIERQMDQIRKFIHSNQHVTRKKPEVPHGPIIHIG